MATTPPSTSRPAATPAPVGTAAHAPSVYAPARAASTHDYKANVERQAREQKSVGNVISLVVYALVACFIFAVVLAGYGGYTITRQIHQQSVTLSDLDSRYTAENKALTDQLKASNDSLTQALSQTQAQLVRQQGLAARQEEMINKLSAEDDANASLLRQERIARAAETATLRARMRTLEEQSRGASRQP